MVGAVRGIDPDTGHHYDDTRRYVDQVRALSPAAREQIFEGNARRVFPRLGARTRARSQPQRSARLAPSTRPDAPPAPARAALRPRVVGRRGAAPCRRRDLPRAGLRRRRHAGRHGPARARRCARSASRSRGTRWAPAWPREVAAPRARARDAPRAARHGLRGAADGSRRRRRARAPGSAGRPGAKRWHARAGPRVAAADDPSRPPRRRGADRGDRRDDRAQDAAAVRGPGATRCWAARTSRRSCATIRVPTLVACGAEDGWSPRAQHEAIARLVPGARLVAIPDCGHMAPMERPDAVAAALRAWLGATADRARRPRVPGHASTLLTVAPFAFPHAPPQGGHHARPDPLHPPPRAAGTRRRRRAGRAACPGPGHRPVQDRPDPADDRAVRLDRQADRRRLPPLHGTQRRHRRRPQGRADRQGRHRPRARDDEAHRAGDSSCRTRSTCSPASA